MKLQHSTQDLEIHGDVQTSTFSIAMNGKAFRVLSDTLYQNKIGSIVREISCNAYDAHVMAGKPDVPFEIHLPDAFEPWFSVKDYGVGLTHNAIKTVFTQYFNSTKENDNDAIGAFGLGAKTPFSYTDQFTVTSIVDGQKTIWTAYIGASGVPDISAMHQEDSVEPTGVEIKMSVKREDFNTFAAEVREQLQYFVIKPVILNRELEFPVFKYIEETADYRMHESGSSITIIQGNVGYPLLVQNLQGKIPSDLYHFANQLARKQIDLLFTIGQIGVTASREGVEYNAATVKNIEDKLQTVLTQLKQGTQAELDALSTDWERAVLMHGKSLLHQSMFPNIKMQFPVAKLTYDAVARSTVGWFERRDLFRKTLKSHNVNNILAHKGVVIIMKDSSKVLSRKLNYLLQNNRNIHEVIVFSSAVKNADDLSAALGDCPVIKASEIILPKTIRANAGPTGPRKRYFEWDGDQWVPRFEKLSEIDEEVVYTITDRLAANEGVDYQYKLLEQLQSVPTLIMIREADYEFVKNNGLFQNVRDYVEAEKKNYNARMYRAAKVKQTIYQAQYSIDSGVRDKMQKLHKLLPADHPVGQFFAKVSEYNTLNESMSADRENKIQQLISGDLSANQRVVNVVKKRYWKLKNRFPVLQWMEDWNFRNRADDDQILKTLVALNKL